MEASSYKKRPISYIAYLWGCKSIIPKAILLCPKKELILENLQVITNSLNLELNAPNTEATDILNLGKTDYQGPAFFYDGRAWDVKLSTKEFQELAAEYYPSYSTHECKAETGQGVTVFSYRVSGLINTHEFERAIYKYIR